MDLGDLGFADLPLPDVPKPLESRGYGNPFVRLGLSPHLELQSKNLRHLRHQTLNGYF